MSKLVSASSSLLSHTKDASATSLSVRSARPAISAHSNIAAYNDLAHKHEASLRASALATLQSITAATATPALATLAPLLLDCACWPTRVAPSLVVGPARWQRARAALAAAAADAARATAPLAVTVAAAVPATALGVMVDRKSTTVVAGAAGAENRVFIGQTAYHGLVISYYAVRVCGGCGNCEHSNTVAHRQNRAAVEGISSSLSCPSSTTTDANSNGTSRDDVSAAPVCSNGCAIGVEAVVSVPRHAPLLQSKYRTHRERGREIAALFSDEIRVQADAAATAAAGADVSLPYPMLPAATHSISSSQVTSSVLDPVGPSAAESGNAPTAVAVGKGKTKNKAKNAGTASASSSTVTGATVSDVGAATPSMVDIAVFSVDATVTVVAAAVSPSAFTPSFLSPAWYAEKLIAAARALPPNEALCVPR